MIATGGHVCVGAQEISRPRKIGNAEGGEEAGADMIFLPVYLPVGEVVAAMDVERGVPAAMHAAAHSKAAPQRRAAPGAALHSLAARAGRLPRGRPS